MPEVAPAAVAVGRRLSPVAHFLLAFLFGLPLVAQNYIEWWAHGAAGFVYQLMAVSATALLAGIVVVLCIAAVLLRLTGKRNASVTHLLNQLPVWLAAFLLAFCLAWATRPDLGVGSDAERFDSLRWRESASLDAPNGELTPRQRMLKGAISAAQSAQSRNEIEALLGPSLDTTYFRESGRDLIYRLGDERGAMSIDSEWLLIWLDGDGKMVRYKIATD